MRRHSDSISIDLARLVDINDDNFDQFVFSYTTDPKDFVAPSRDANETEYFAALAQASLATDGLPFIYRYRDGRAAYDLEDADGNIDLESVNLGLKDGRIIKGERLYKLSSSDSGLIQPEDLDGVAGMALAIRQLGELEENYLAAELRQEMKNIAKNKMVGEAQINKILALLKLLRDREIGLCDYRAVRLSRIKESPNMFGRGEDPDMENQDGPSSRSRNSREREGEKRVGFKERVIERERPIEREREIVADGGEAGEGTIRDSKKKPNWPQFVKRILLPVTSPIDPVTQTRLREASKRVHEREAERVKILQHGIRGRFAMAITGGLALIGPMLIMAIHPSLKKNLITVSVCVFVFAILMAWKVPVEPSDLLAATAGYAAVLVVFTTGLS